MSERGAPSGPEIQRAREALGLNRDGLATLLSTTEQSVRRWETEASVPRVRYHERLWQLVAGHLPEPDRDDVVMEAGPERDALQRSLLTAVAERVGSGHPLTKQDLVALRASYTAAGLVWRDD